MPAETESRLIDSPRFALHLSPEDHRLLREIRATLERRQDKTIKLAEIFRLGLHSLAKDENITV